jgi:hypothetical protein
MCVHVCTCSTHVQYVCSTLHITCMYAYCIISIAYKNTVHVIQLLNFTTAVIIALLYIYLFIIFNLCFPFLKLHVPYTVY